MGRLIFQSNKEENQQQKSPPIQQILSFPLILTNQIHQAINDSKSYKPECTYIGKHVDRLALMLRSTAQQAVTTPLYERPLRCIVHDMTRNLKRTLTLVRKCRHKGGIIRRFVSIVSVADFRNVFELLDVSIGDMNWLLSIFNVGEKYRSNEGIILTLPPIASSDPILAWVWSCIASLYLSSSSFKIDAANELSTLARDSDRNKMIIIEEGGVTPLLKLLKDELAPEIQIAGAIALFNLANDQNKARFIFNEHGVLFLVHALRNSTVLVQTEVVKVIARMAEHDHVSQKCFAKENVVETLVTLLSANVFDDDQGKINKKALSSTILSRNKKSSAKETPGLILELNTNCSRALWVLAKGNADNCRKITETKGLICLAKLIEKEDGELQINCLMTVLEITYAAECNTDIRRSAFKTNSLAAKAVTSQLLRLINQPDNNHVIKIAAIRAIGHLARTFPARQTQVVTLLVQQLSDTNPDVATESVIALGKFTCLENYLRTEHSKTIVEFEGVQLVMKLLRGNERTQYHALVLLCYLALQAGNCERFQARIMTALEGANKSVACQFPELRALVAKTVHHLNMFPY